MSFLMKISLRIKLTEKYRELGLSKTRNYYSALRLCSSDSKSSLIDRPNGGQVPPNKEFKEIYRFRYIPLGFAINKWKWPQTLLTAIVLPISTATYFSGNMEFDLLIGIILSGCFITGNIYGYGSFFTKAVGFMYLSEDGSTIKISYLSFWGDRVDKEMPVDDIMPLADCPRSPIDYVYRTIHSYSADDVNLKLFLKIGGQITDPNKFMKVFGDYTKY